MNIFSEIKDALEDKITRNGCIIVLTVFVLYWLIVFGVFYRDITQEFFSEVFN